MYLRVYAGGEHMTRMANQVIMISNQIIMIDGPHDCVGEAARENAVTVAGGGPFPNQTKPNRSSAWLIIIMIRFVHG